MQEQVQAEIVLKNEIKRKSTSQAEDFKQLQKQYDQQISNQSKYIEDLQAQLKDSQMQ